MGRDPNLRERLLFLMSPERGAKAYRNRLKTEVLERYKMAATGYGKHGASKTLNSMIGWLPGGGAAEDDVDLQGATLRIRSRDLYAGGGLARSGISKLTTNVVGWGIVPKPKIDAELLGLSDEQKDEWERNAAREFRLWAESKNCDAERTRDFYTLQQLAFRSELISGDAFVVFGMKPNKLTPYQTTLRLLEADRVSTPDSTGDTSEVKLLDNNGRIIDGVEVDGEGVVVRYHIASRHPLLENSNDTVEWSTIEAEGRDTGMPNILHIMLHERPEQRRGVPFVSAEIEQIKQLDRYINSELAANVVAAMLTAFLESDADDGKAGMDDAIDEEDKVTHDELHLELGAGAIYDLPPGKKIQTVNPLRNNSGFESFVNALMTVIGSSMEIPKEVLVSSYNSNYTAARAAMLDFWKTVKVHRSAFNKTFNQPVYEAWLAEAVALGRIEAPGFFEDPLIRQAWCGCMWMGSTMGHVDPLKEVNAAAQRIALNISTEEQEAAEFNGNDWRANIAQRKKEISAAREMNPVQTAQSPPNDNNTDDEEDDNDE